MSGVLAKHIAKLTVSLLVLATIGASAFVQSLHVDNLRRDATALRVVAARRGVGGSDYARLSDTARPWLENDHSDVEARHAGARKLIQDFLHQSGVSMENILESKGGGGRDGEPAPRSVWRLIRVNDRSTFAVSVLGLGISRKNTPNTVSAALDEFLTDHTPRSYDVLVGVHLPERNESVQEIAEAAVLGLETRAFNPGTRIASVALDGAAVEVAAQTGINAQQNGGSRMRLVADVVTIAGPSPADLILGQDREATELRSDAARIGRVDRLYGGLSLEEARTIVSRAIASRYDAVNLVGIEFPAEYFALGLAFASAAVMLAILTTLRLALSRGATPLCFEETDSLASLMLGNTWGRTLLWLIVPLLAMVGARPDSWLAGSGMWAFIGGVALTCTLGLIALRFGSAATRGRPTK